MAILPLVGVKHGAKIARVAAMAPRGGKAMYFNEEEMAYAQKLAGEAGEDVWRVEGGDGLERAGESTPEMLNDKVGNLTPQRRRLNLRRRDDRAAKFG